MNKKQQLKVCNWALAVITIPTLATSLLLEIQHGSSLFGISYPLSVTLHVAFSLLTCLLVAFHLYLHFGKKAWKKKITHLKSPVTKALVWLSLVVVASGIVALANWLLTWQHGTLGGLHGKIGFVFLALAIGHTIKRISFFKR